MALPRNRVSNAKKNSRRAHHARTPKNVAACSNCGTAKLPHTVCGSCGQYNNRVVLAASEEA